MATRWAKAVIRRATVATRRAKAVEQADKEGKMLGDNKTAWFKDPDGNIISLLNR